MDEYEQRKRDFILDQVARCADAKGINLTTLKRAVMDRVRVGESEAGQAAPLVQWLAQAISNAGRETL